MRLTSEQQCAAQANTSVLVIAGAGTGKTHTLSHRYLHHLRCGLSPLQIVAVTFTDRAAAELRARVRQDLHEQRPDDTETPALLEAAQISTLHALAARVCRDHPDAAGVPADFAILEDLEGRVWLAETLDEVVAELPAKLFDHLPYHRCREALVLLLEEPVLARHALAHGPQEWPAWVTEARTTALRNLLADAGWREAARLVRTSEGGEGDRIEDARRQAVDALDLLDRGDAASGLAALDRVNLQGGSKKAWPEGDLSSVKEALKLLRAHARASLKDGMVVLALGEADRRLAEALPAIRQAYEQVQGALDRAKRKKRVLDYADLERHALQALALPSVRQHYARRWKAILVDEFQDTNPVQEALLERLSENAILTVVGDDKQAIYGFRGAEAAVFRRARERICRAGGQDVVLRESFRSHHLLLDTINTTFRTVLGTQHQDLQARRRAAPHDGPHVQLLTIQPERGSNKSQRQVIEARAIAARLRTMLDDGTLVHDKRAGKLRPVQPSDMAVLTRTWAPLDTYGEILPSLGVPAVHTGGGNLLDTREAKDALALLRFLNDPRDDLALAAVLRSPFFACSDRELYQFAQTAIQDGTPCWWQALDDTPPDALAGAARTLKILHSQQPERPPSRLLQLADTLTGYTAVLANLPGAERRQADWGGFLELVRNFEQGSQDTFTLMRRLRSLLRAGIDVPRPNLQPGAAVTLMTIHRSKGLEWPIVIAADLARQAGGKRPGARMDPQHGIAVLLQDGDTGEASEPALFTLIRRQSDRAEEKEARRILYVTLTRARDRVLLTATEPKGGLLDVLQPGLEAAHVPHEELPFDPTEAVYPAPPPPPVLKADDTGLWRCSPADLGELAQYVPPKLPPRDTHDRAQDAGWTVAREFAAMNYPEYQALFERLQDAGLPAPHPYGYESQLTRKGAGTGQYALATWHTEGITLALVDIALPPGDYDQILLRADPEHLEHVQAELLTQLVNT